MVFVFILLAIGVWLACGRPKKGFLHDFAKLLDRPEFVDGLGNRLIRRSFLKGEFRGRKVVILLQNGRRRSPRIVVSMETHATATMETYDFGGYRADRETELALFALEVKHELTLRHSDRCLKAKWVPQQWSSLLTFPPLFEPSKWQFVLEGMSMLAGSLERRAA